MCMLWIHMRGAPTQPQWYRSDYMSKSAHLFTFYFRLVNTIASDYGATAAIGAVALGNDA